MPHRALLPAFLAFSLAACTRGDERAAADDGERPTPPPANTLQRTGALAQAATSASELMQALQQLRRGAPVDYQLPTVTELEAFGAWFSGVALAAIEGRLPGREPPSGFQGLVTADGRGWLLAELEQRRRGAGAFLLRPAASRELIVQAPHTFFDQGTLQLSVALYEQLGARALMINTVHRAGEGTREQRRKLALAGTAESDLAHADSSYYQQAHRELCRLLPQAVTVQLHGFRDERVPEAQFIVSAANTKADPAPLARALNAELGPAVARIYPDEVKRLGGTRNAQARVSVVEGCGLIHLEIAGSIRERLTREPALRQRVARAIESGLFEG